LAELAELEAVSGLLGWDQETMMPPGGVRARAEQLATLERLFHERLTAAEVEDWLQRLTGGDDVGEGEQAVPAGEPDIPADRDAALIRVARRDRDKALRVPISLRSELARALARPTRLGAGARGRRLRGVPAAAARATTQSSMTTSRACAPREDEDRQHERPPAAVTPSRPASPRHKVPDSDAERRRSRCHSTTPSIITPASAC